MLDEMYLQKYPQKQSGKYVGVDKEGNLYKRIVASIVIESKQSINFVAQGIPEFIFNGEWLAEKISEH